jgi:hypothetical protein
MTQQPQLFADAFVQYGPFVVWHNGYVDRTAVRYTGKVVKITAKHIWVANHNGGTNKLKKLDYAGGWQMVKNKSKLFLYFEHDPLVEFLSHGL